MPGRTILIIQLWSHPSTGNHGVLASILMAMAISYNWLIMAMVIRIEAK
jgi:hypothetical protein